jgi:hypothetical protein
MKRIFLIGCLALAPLPTVGAQSPGTLEPLSAWPYFKELRFFRAESTLRDFVLDREVLNQARPDQADLRLYDGAGREIPYVLRVRHDVDTQSEFTVREFNRSVGGAAAEVSCDLGVQPVEHNLVEIDTAGTNYRRLADVQGSADGVTWSTLASQAILFRFTAVGRSVEQLAVPYPASRYRYLRVRVSRDPQVDSEAPQITALRVRRAVRVQGEMVSFPAEREERDADRMDGRPASVWRIDLGGRIPFERLSLEIATPAFSRQFELEIVDDPSAPVLIASGELTRSAETGQPLSVAFAERIGRHLKLTVIDDRNPPLPIGAIAAIGAARQVIFEGAFAAAGPVRLYYGNPRAIEPNYDLGARIPANPGNTVRLALSSQSANPVYRPEPKPFSERSPWLIYVILAAASLALAYILLSMARAAKAQPQV